MSVHVYLNLEGHVELNCKKWRLEFGSYVPLCDKAQIRRCLHTSRDNNK